MKNSTISPSRHPTASVQSRTPSHVMGKREVFPLSKQQNFCFYNVVLKNVNKTRTGKNGCQDCVSEGQPHLIWQQFLLCYCSKNSSTSSSQGKMGDHYWMPKVNYFIRHDSANTGKKCTRNEGKREKNRGRMKHKLKNGQNPQANLHFRRLPMRILVCKKRGGDIWRHTEGWGKWGCKLKGKEGIGSRMADIFIRYFLLVYYCGFPSLDNLFCFIAFQEYSAAVTGYFKTVY